VSLTLVIGGTRSGKSAHAERLARATGLPVRYVATADGADPAMAERIRAHAARRPADWTTVEAGTSLADALRDAAGTCVLLDGLGPWIATALHRTRAFEDPAPEALRRVADELLADVERAVHALAGADAAIVVAEQAGEGVLPPDAASRAWLDLLGEATQRFAAHAARVELVVAGRPLTLADGVLGEAMNDAVPGAARSDAAGLAARPAAAAADTDDLAALRRHGDQDVRPGDADHAVNVVAGGPPDWLRAALADALAHDAGRYPDEAEATAALAALHGRTPEEIVPTNGAAEALWLLPAALRPRLAACVHPAFTEAEAALRAHGVPVVRVLRDPQRGFTLDPAAVPEEADLVVVGNPASPSGTLDPASALLALRRPGRVVVVDEAFMDLVPGEPASLVREPLEDAIVVRSLTKTLAIPGLRAGYAVTAPPLAQRLRAVRPPWSANALALAALAAAARRPDALAAAAARAEAERADLAERLARLDGVRTWAAAANFCLVEVADGPAVVAALRERAVAVRPAASFPGLGPGHLRITARTPEQNARLVAALEEALAAAGRTHEVADSATPPAREVAR
jgi:histidinol-phosphate/aromatic aminotransferase/cobyric acid decarboxylase-like protein/adenosyl cobinamide kinase/adenosyl cobinamide phosphate guanylyltransferase